MKLYFEADGVTGERLSSEAKITKETKNFLYLKVGIYNGYRLNRKTKEVQVRFGNRWELLRGYVEE